MAVVVELPGIRATAIQALVELVEAGTAVLALARLSPQLSLVLMDLVEAAVARLMQRREAVDLVEL